MSYGKFRTKPIYKNMENRKKGNKINWLFIACYFCVLYWCIHLPEVDAGKKYNFGREIENHISEENISSILDFRTRPDNSGTSKTNRQTPVRTKQGSRNGKTKTNRVPEPSSGRGRIVASGVSGTGTNVTTNNTGKVNYKKELIQRAWDKYGDRTFLALLQCENGAWTTDRKHPRAKNSYGTDYGLCGMNSVWNMDIIKDPNFKDFDWQLEQCYQKFISGTPFWSIYDKIYRNKKIVGKKLNQNKVANCISKLSFNPIGNI